MASDYILDGVWFCISSVVPWTKHKFEAFYKL